MKGPVLKNPDMPGARLNKKLLLCGFFVATFSVFGWLRLLFLINSYEFRPRRHAPDATKLFSTAVPNNADWYRQHCFGNTKENFTIGKLEDLMEGWHSAQHPGCKELHRIFDDIYQVTRKSGQVVIPDTFQTKVLKWLGNNYDLLKDVKLQFVTTVFNLITHESSVFNPIRSKRPGVATGDRDVANYVDELAKETENDCDFCAYQFKTAEDTFGRIESTHSATAANTFKYDSFHALILLKTHHPTAFSEEQFMDFTSTAMKWFMKCYDTDKQYRYPHLMWDSLPKASASQVHPHAQASLSAARHYGLMEHLHLSAEHYADQHDGNNYFSHLLQIHNALGLTTFLGNASAMAYLTPKKDHEVFIMSRTSGEDFFRLIYYTIRTFIDDLKLPAFSMAMFLPRLEPFSAPTSEDIPAVARIITRGPPDNPRNDISSMELFGASNVNVDPFAVIGHIKNTIHRNKKGVQPSPHVKEDALIDQKKEEAPHVQATQEKSEVNQNSKDSDNQVQGGAL